MNNTFGPALESGPSSWEPAMQKTQMSHRYQFTEIHQVDQAWFKSNRLLGPGADQDTIHAYKLLHTQILKTMYQNNWNSIGIIGARSGQGATLTAINLAISIALEHSRTVLLADFNLRQPSIHTYFNYCPEFGIGDYLNDKADVLDMLFTPGIDSLVVLPGRERIIHSSEFLTTPRMSNLVQEMKGRYAQRIIIFDLPPILETDDAVAFMDQYDAGLLIIEEGVTRKSDMRRISELLGDKPILGAVLNNAK